MRKAAIIVLVTLALLVAAVNIGSYWGEVYWDLSGGAKESPDAEARSTSPRTVPTATLPRWTALWIARGQVIISYGEIDAPPYYALLEGLKQDAATVAAIAICAVAYTDEMQMAHDDWQRLLERRTWRINLSVASNADYVERTRQIRRNAARAVAGWVADDSFPYYCTYSPHFELVIGFRLSIVLALLLTYPTVSVVRGALRQRRRRLHHLCLQCGYDLRATETGRCPECGCPTENP